MMRLSAASQFRSGFKTPSKAQWLRCRPPINAHIPMYAARYRSACALMHTLICLDQTCNPASAGPLNLIWGFETTSNDIRRQTPFLSSTGFIPLAIIMYRIS